MSRTDGRDYWLRTEDGPPIFSMTTAGNASETLQKDEVVWPGHLWDYKSG